MRDIKFRAWDKNESKLVYAGEKPKWFKEGSHLTSGDILNWYEDEDIMQYTGLKDKNGREIYEGDIVSLDNGCIDTVGFHSGCFMVEHAIQHYEATYWPSDIQVVGNIYENPELLREEASETRS